MSVKGKFNKTAGYIKEETGELLDDAELAIKGRVQRNKGRIQDKELPKMTPPGTGN